VHRAVTIIVIIIVLFFISLAPCSRDFRGSGFSSDQRSESEQERRAVTRKPRDAAAVLFGLKYADTFTTSLRVPGVESQASELQTYRRKTKFNAKWYSRPRVLESVERR